MAADLLGAMRVEIVGDNSKLDKSIKDSKASTEKFGKSTASLGKNLGKLFAGIGFAVVAKKIFDLGKASSALAASAEEIESKFNVVFGQSALIIKDWAQVYSDSVGRSTTDTLGFLGSIGDLLKPLGFSKDAVDAMSQEVVKLANDLGSFNDMPTADVMRDIEAALTGSFEVTKKYGVVLNETVIKQEAMNRGLFDGKGVVDAQVKAQIALELIIKGTADAQGDLLATQDSFTNATIALESAQKDLGIALGKNINEGMKPLLQVTTNITKALANWIKKNADINDFLKDMATGADIAKRSNEELVNVIEAGIKASEDMAKGFGGQFEQDLIDAGKAANILLAARQRSAAADKQFAAEATAINKKAKEEAAAALKAQELAITRTGALNEAFDQTREGQIKAIEAQIEFFETFEPQGPMATAILEDLNEQLVNLNKTTEENTETSTENFLTKIEQQEELSNIEQIALENRQARREAEEQAETEMRERQIQAAQNAAITMEMINRLGLDSMLAGFEEIGAALFEGEDGFKALGKVALNSIAEIVGALGAQLAAQAALAFFPFFGVPNIVSGIGAAAGSAAAFTAAGVIKAAAASFEFGGVVAGSNFTGDNVPAMVNSGEMILTQGQQAQLFALANSGGTTTNNSSNSVNINSMFSLGNDAKLNEAAERLFPALQKVGRRRGATIGGTG